MQRLGPLREKNCDDLPPMLCFQDSFCFPRSPFKGNGGEKGRQRGGGEKGKEEEDMREQDILI